MASNSFGNIFRITTFGESHGPTIGVVIDGCPSGIEITDTNFPIASLKSVFKVNLTTKEETPIDLDDITIAGDGILEAGTDALFGAGIGLLGKTPAIKKQTKND